MRCNEENPNEQQFAASAAFSLASGVVLDRVVGVLVVAVVVDVVDVVVVGAAAAAAADTEIREQFQRPLWMQRAPS